MHGVDVYTLEQLILLTGLKHMFAQTQQNVSCTTFQLEHDRVMCTVPLNSSKKFQLP
jgi:hypothetical protein